MAQALGSDRGALSKRDFRAGGRIELRCPLAGAGDHRFLPSIVRKFFGNLFGNLLGGTSRGTKTRITLETDGLESKFDL